MFLLLHNPSPPAAAPLGTAANAALATDEQLAADAQTNPQALTPLHERYLDRIYRFCYNCLGDRQSAEDAASEVFLQALAHLRTYRSANFGAWLYTIARNVVVAHYRRQGRSQSLSDAQAVELACDPLAGQTERMALLLALDQLSDDQRAAVELPAAGWSDAQIGAMLHKSEAAVRMIRYRAMQRLQALLADDLSGDRQ